MRICLRTIAIGTRCPWIAAESRTVFSRLPVIFEIRNRLVSLGPAPFACVIRHYPECADGKPNYASGGKFAALQLQNTDGMNGGEGEGISSPVYADRQPLHLAVWWRSEPTENFRPLPPKDARGMNVFYPGFFWFLLDFWRQSLYYSLLYVGLSSPFYEKSHTLSFAALGRIFQPSAFICRNQFPGPGNQFHLHPRARARPTFHWLFPTAPPRIPRFTCSTAVFRRRISLALPPASLARRIRSIWRPPSSRPALTVCSFLRPPAPPPRLSTWCSPPTAPICAVQVTPSPNRWPFRRPAS